MRGEGRGEGRHSSLAAVLFAFLLLAAAAPPATVDNDDSCDISQLPAATLLLPYFEVDVNSPPATAVTTLFTIQNSTASPQIARVTLWTDFAFPMLTFNVFLTGYDVQGINLYDIFARGAIAPGPTPLDRGGTSIASPPGLLSQPYNPHFLPDAATTCVDLPGRLDDSLRLELQTAFTKGTIAAPGCTNVRPVGGVHRNAVGYATIDVVANCRPASPIQAGYFTNDILFDNVLTGDYQHINPNPATGNYAGGNPLVHIRAVPEGGTAGAIVETRLPYTFYDLYTTGALWRTQDRRQPLPSAFMPRFIQGGTGAFNTNLLIWREAYMAPTTCPFHYDANEALYAEFVRFDEHENPTFGWDSTIGTYIPLPSLPSAASVPLASAIFPEPARSGDVGGWLFLNLNNGGSPAYTAARNYRFGTTVWARQSQAWVVTSMFAEGRYATEADAVAFGNGCSPAPDYARRAAIGPAGNGNP